MLPDRSASGTVAWLKANLGAKIIYRDRHGLYAAGTHEGAPRARQVADHFHLLQNQREIVDKEQLSLPASLQDVVVATPDASEILLHADSLRHSLLASTQNNTSVDGVGRCCRALRSLDRADANRRFADEGSARPG